MVDRLRQLLEACVEGNAWVVSAILDEGVDVDISDDDEVTALQVASANGHEHLVRLLIMKGAALDKANSSGWTPLLQAARHGHTSIVALLLQNQADINANTDLGANAMVLASRGAHLQTCQLLEDYGIDLGFPNGAVDGSTCEFTAVMVAALHGHDNIVRHLVDRSNDVNYRTPTLGISSLMFTALNGHMTTAQILIERGADPNLTNVNGDTALEIAMVRGRREVQNYLDRKTTRKPRAAYQDVKPDIIDATRHGNIQRIREILDEDLTQRDACSPQDGATPLMFAAMAGRLDIGKVLVEKGCDVNRQDNISGWTALMQATYHGKKEMARYLISVGADVCVAAKNGCTTFDMVTFMENVDTDLCRLIASKAMQRSQFDHLTKKSKSIREDSTSTVELLSTDSISEEDAKSGLKAWWNRMSNRFRNLKLGRTFNLSNNRSPSMQLDETEITIKNPSPVNHNYENSTLSKPMSPEAMFVTKRTERERKTERERRTERGIALKTTSEMNRTTMNDRSSATNERNSATNDRSSATANERNSATAHLYSLGMLNTTSTNPLNNTMKPLTPFSPPPTFQTNGNKMPPISLKKSVVSRLGSTPTLGGLTPSVTSFTGRSTLGLVASSSNSHHARTGLRSHQQRPTKSPFASSAEVSPSASSDASVLSNGMSLARSKVASSTSSSTGTLTAGSGGGGSVTNNNSNSRPSTDVVKKEAKSKRQTSSSSRPDSSFVSDGDESNSKSNKPNNTSQLSNLKPVSRNSSPSNASTLTPSPTTTPKADKPQESTIASRSKAMSSFASAVPPTEESPVPEDIGCVLQQLSLERYHPIFEEQEVDMEAFLTLTDCDLLELGISNDDSRHQILTSINELNVNKDRERQQHQQAISHFNSTLLRPQAPFDSGNSQILDFGEWTEEGTVDQQ